LFIFASKKSNVDIKDLLFDTGLELSPPRPPDPSLLISQAVPSKKQNDLLNTFQIAKFHKIYQLAN
jgi:hypothetical protein